MINNLEEAIQYFKGKNVTVAGCSFGAKVIMINNQKTILPLTCEELNKVVKSV